jgi:hypothetical protein
MTMATEKERLKKAAQSLAKIVAPKPPPPEEEKKA